jgi:hypothetical protein
MRIFLSRPIQPAHCGAADNERQERDRFRHGSAQRNELGDRKRRSEKRSQVGLVASLTPYFASPISNQGACVVVGVDVPVVPPFAPAPWLLAFCTFA